MSSVKRIGPGSSFKVGLVVYGILGLIVGVICALFALAGTAFMGPERGLPFTGPLLAIVCIIAGPILYGLFGAIMFAIGALIYNLASGWVGGLEVDIS